MESVDLSGVLLLELLLLKRRTTIHHVRAIATLVEEAVHVAPSLWGRQFRDDASADFAGVSRMLPVHGLDSGFIFEAILEFHWWIVLHRLHLNEGLHALLSLIGLGTF